jgi:hypothetical protein
MQAEQYQRKAVAAFASPRLGSALRATSSSRRRSHGSSERVFRRGSSTPPPPGRHLCSRRARPREIDACPRGTRSYPRRSKRLLDGLFGLSEHRSPAQCRSKRYASAIYGNFVEQSAAVDMPGESPALDVLPRLGHTRLMDRRRSLPVSYDELGARRSGQAPNVSASPVWMSAPRSRVSTTIAAPTTSVVRDLARSSPARCAAASPNATRPAP